MISKTEIDKKHVINTKFVLDILIEKYPISKNKTVLAYFQYGNIGVILLNFK